MKKQLLYLTLLGLGGFATTSHFAAQATTRASELDKNITDEAQKQKYANLLVQKLFNETFLSTSKQSRRSFRDLLEKIQTKKSGWFSTSYDTNKKILADILNNLKSGKAANLSKIESIFTKDIGISRNIFGSDFEYQDYTESPLKTVLYNFITTEMPTFFDTVTNRMVTQESIKQQKITDEKEAKRKAQYAQQEKEAEMMHGIYGYEESVSPEQEAKIATGAYAGTVATIAGLGARELVTQQAAAEEAQREAIRAARTGSELYPEPTETTPEIRPETPPVSPTVLQESPEPSTLVETSRAAAREASKQEAIARLQEAAQARETGAQQAAAQLAAERQTEALAEQAVARAEGQDITRGYTTLGERYLQQAAEARQQAAAQELAAEYETAAAEQESLVTTTAQQQDVLNELETQSELAASNLDAAKAAVEKATTQIAQQGSPTAATAQTVQVGLNNASATFDDLSEKLETLASSESNSEAAGKIADLQETIKEAEKVIAKGSEAFKELQSDLDSGDVSQVQSDAADLQEAAQEASTIAAAIAAGWAGFADIFGETQFDYSEIGASLQGIGAGLQALFEGLGAAGQAAAEAVEAAAQ